MSACQQSRESHAVRFVYQPRAAGLQCRSSMHRILGLDYNMRTHCRTAANLTRHGDGSRRLPHRLMLLDIANHEDGCKHDIDRSPIDHLYPVCPVSRRMLNSGTILHLWASNDACMCFIGQAGLDTGSSKRPLLGEQDGYLSHGNQVILPGDYRCNPLY